VNLGIISPWKDHRRPTPIRVSSPTPINHANSGPLVNMRGGNRINSASFADGVNGARPGDPSNMVTHVMQHSSRRQGHSRFLGVSIQNVVTTGQSFACRPKGALVTMWPPHPAAKAG